MIQPVLRIPPFTSERQGQMQMVCGGARINQSLPLQNIKIYS